jgi:predicted component of type VI protein secretion system
MTVPPSESAELKEILSQVTYGWGMIPVIAQIGDTKWETAMFPKDGSYILPLRLNVRKAQNLQEGDSPHATISVIMAS